MPNYSKTIIYKLINYDHPDLVYVGSTTDFTKRKAQHKRLTNSDNQSKVYQNIRENGGWQCWHMIKICDFPCSTATDARQEEDRQMMELKANLNSRKAYTSDEERRNQQKQYRETNRDQLNEKQKQYRETNKEKIKQYYDTNKEKIKEYKQQYQITNKERLNDISKQYYESNKEQINIKRSEKIKCECGCFLSKSNISTHKKTVKHQKLPVQSTIESVSPLD